MKMSNPVDRKYNEKQRSYSECIAWDLKEKKYYIKRTFPHSEEIEKHPLSEWGLVRKVSTFILIARQLESEELEQPVKVVYYKIPITYEIKPESEDWYLVPQVTKNPDDPFEKKFLQIVMKNCNNGQGLAVPIPNDAYNDCYGWLKITKGKSVRISKTELEEAVLSGQCMGVYSMDLRNRIVS